jgi:hypothetical protein
VDRFARQIERRDWSKKCPSKHIFPESADAAFRARALANRTIPMIRLCLLVAICCSLSLTTALGDERKFTVVDLKEHLNHKMGDVNDNDAEGNDFSLEAGEHTIEGVKITVGERVMLLGSKAVGNRPEKIEGIKVGRKAARLHILHATVFGGGANEPGSPFHVADDEFIGAYQIHYEDKSSESIAIEYGKDVRDWWFREKEKETTRAKVAWKGDNRFAASYSCRLRLYLTEWKNPKPDLKIVSIDFTGRKDETIAAPFCVAITAEEE